jgi:hypothetical protein
MEKSVAMKSLSNIANHLLSKFGFRLSRLQLIPVDIIQSNQVVAEKRGGDLSPVILDEIFSFYRKVPPLYEGLDIRIELQIGKVWSFLLKKDRNTQLELIRKSDKSGYGKLLENMFFNELLYGLWNHHYFDEALSKRRLPGPFFELCRLFEKVSSRSIGEIASRGFWRTWGALTANGVITFAAPDHALQAFNIANLLRSIENPRKNFTVLDLGSGYGGMAEMLLDPNLNLKGDLAVSVILVDIPLNLTTAYAYLAHRFGTERVSLLKDPSEVAKISPEDGKIWLLPTIFLDNLKINIDVVNNAQSLSEMDVGNVKYYMDILLRESTTFFIETNVNDISDPLKHGPHGELFSRDFPIPASHRLLARFSAPEGWSRYVTSIYTSSRIS